jgi:parallel beta-helix repeat protein
MKTMRWVTMAVAVAVVSFLVLTSFSPPASAGNTLVVDDDGYGSASDCDASDVAYSTIQAAIDVAGSGDTIVVCPGTYNETLRLNATKAQDLSVIGAGASSTFLTGGIRFEGNYSGLDVEGFTITGDGRQRPGLSQATVGDSSSLVMVTDARFADNVFDGENVADRFGLYLDRLSGSFTFEGNEVKNYEGWGTLDLNQTYNPVTSYTFNDNNIHDNKGSSALRGSSSDRTDTVVADGNTFDNNGGGDSWAALEINEAVSATVTDNVITDTVAGSWGEGEALQFWHIDSLTVTGNTLDNNYQGIYFPGTDWASDLSGVEIHDNNITNSDQFGFWAEPENTGTADATDNWWGSANGPTHASNSFNVGAQGEVVSDHVNFTPWLDAPAPGGDSLAPVTTTDPVGSWPSIQAGIDASNAGGDVNAKAGTYTENLNVASRSDVNVVGENRDTTIVKPAATSSWAIAGYPQYDTRQAAVRVVGSTDIDISGFTFDFSLVNGTTYATGLLMWDSTGIVSENRLENMGVPGAYYEITGYVRAPDYTDAARAEVSFLNNEFIDTGRMGVVTHDFVNATISGNTFTKTWDDFGYAMEIGSASTATVTGNTISGFDTPAATDNSSVAGIYIENSFTDTVPYHVDKPVVVSGNIISSNQYGVYIGNDFAGYAHDVDIKVTLSDNTISNNAYGGVIVRDEGRSLGSSVTVNASGNQVTDNGGFGYYTDTTGNGEIHIHINGDVITGDGEGVIMADWAGYYGLPDNSLYDVSVHNSDLSGNSIGAEVYDVDEPLDATDNWWGSANGPTHASNTFNVGSQGVLVTDGVIFTPWLDAAPPGGVSFAPVTTTSPVGSYSSIQAGVNASNPGGTVNAATGVFSENVTVGKSVIVQAGSSPVVDCGGPGNGFAIGANNVTINGFEIRNCSNGIQGQTSNSTISNNIIHDNLNYGGSNGVGILLWGDNDNNQISGNTVYNNDRQGVVVGHCDFAGPGGACTAGGTQISSGNTISGNVIHDNGRYTQPNGPDASQYGIQLWNADGNEIKLNEVSNHKGSGFSVGVYLCNADSNDVHDNAAHDNQYNIAAYGCEGSSDGNNIHLNTLSAPTDSNVRLFGGSPSNTVNDNTMSGGVYGVRVSPGNTDTAVTANGISGFKQNGVRIDGSSDVDVSTNSIDGQGACNSSFSPGSSPETDTRCYGVEWIDSTGMISANTITGVKIGAGTGGQTGVGIRASARSGKTTGVTIDHNVVSAYQKNGMVITGQYGGTVSATVDTNIVTGLGPINFIAQNGVQVSSGASATLSNNNISGHDYTPSTNSAAGVLVQNATATIQENAIHGNMVGAYLQGATIPEFSGNTVTATRHTGVYLELVEDSEVSNNSISTSGIGLYLADSSGIAAKLNTISDNGDGVVIDGDSHNDSFTDNRILNNRNTGVTVAPYYVEPSGLVFRLNQIAGNWTYGIDNTTSNVVDALSNWWGDVTGPYHPTKNPAGLGNDVSDNVLFDPWVKAIQYFGDTSIPVGSTARLKARFLNSSGTSPAVAGVTVVLELAASGGGPVSGSPFSAVTDGSGVASVNVPGLGIGVYDVTARWNPLTDGDSLTVFGPGDSDGDGVADSVDNCPTVYNPDQLNSDGGRRPNGPIPGEWASNPSQDKMGDACDPDDDNDGLPDTSEALCRPGPEFSCPPATCSCDLAVGTRPTATTCKLDRCDPLNADTDGDRVVDGYEVANGYDPLNPLSKPTWVGGSDSDGDGLLDWFERGGYNTCAFDGDTRPGWTTCSVSQDSDGDGCADTLEVLDLNGDRGVNVGDQLALALRTSAIGPGDPVSDAIFDVTKDGGINVGDQLLMALNTCDTKPGQLGCSVCPAE